jgi:hypothetical protein
MSTATHALPAALGLPAPHEASAGDLGRAIETLSALTPSLHTPVTTEAARLEQYRRALALGQWVTEAAADLEHALSGHMARSVR